MKDEVFEQDLIPPLHGRNPGQLFEDPIFNLLPFAIYVCDAQGSIIKFNERAIQLWKLRPHENEKGTSFFSKFRFYTLPQEVNKTPVHINNSMTVGINVELLMERPDGSIVYVKFNTTPIKDQKGEPAGTIGCFYDISTPEKMNKEFDPSSSIPASSFEKIIREKSTDINSKNDALKKSEERYHKMVEEVEDYAIILLDENGYIQNWNKGAEKIKGYKDVEIIGKSFQVFYLPEDRANGLPIKLITEAREKGKAIHEGWRMRKDGTKFWGSIVLTALHNEANEIIGFSKVTRDLTERKITEDKLHEYTSQLQFQNEQLEQFAYAASHDMKEPLRKILFYNNHLLETLSGGLQEKEAEYLRRSINAARRMERLINDLLEYSKAASDMHGFESVDLNEIVDEILLTYKEPIEEKKAFFQISGLPRVNGIPFQLRQVFDNLISNALKYSYPGRDPLINISSEKVEGSTVKGLIAGHEYQKIEVCDNGIGFDTEYSDKIFELFQRLGSVKYSGTGVGLALCKRIAQNHHGSISATGSAGNGACFQVYLPA